MEIHKLVCDECKKEKDLTVTYYGGENIWQKLYIDEQLTSGIKISKSIHLCSIECVLEYLNKHKEN